jgi:tetratricopeptide (TPR) repeat protein
VRYDPVEEVLELLSDGQRDVALARLDRVLREEPYQGGLFALRGLICADGGRLDEAGEAVRQAREIAPEHPFVQYAFGVVALQQGSMLEAIQAAREARRLSPAYADAALLEARARAALGQWDSVRSLAAEVVECEPANEEAALLEAIATEAAREGSLDPERWKRLGEQFPLNAVARAGSGWTRLEAGQISSARAEFEQALAVDPSLSWAKAGLVVALKASNPVYALLLRFFLWFGRLPPRTRTIVLVGGLIGYNMLRRTAAEQPELRPLIVPLLIAYLGFLTLSWLADPLLNLLLMARPEGRRLLDADQRRAAVLVGSCLALGAATGIAGALVHEPRVMLGGLGVGLGCFAIAAAYSCEGRKRRQVGVLAAVAIGASLVSIVVPEGMDAALFLAAVLSAAAATWMSHFGSDRFARR